MKRFMIFLMVALMAMAPAVVTRFMHWHLDPVAGTAVFGIAVLAAGFMLSWGAEAAEGRISQGLILAVVALITVLPEYAVDMYYAFQAGKHPQSPYIHYAAANMTGANRLLIGLGWPLLVFLHWRRTREKAITLARTNAIEVGFLLLASAYAFVILMKNRIDALDAIALFGIFGAYLWQVGQLPKGEKKDEEEEEPGPAAALSTLGTKAQWTWMAALSTVAAAVIFISAEPFAESIVASGRIVGIDEFLLIQWVAPLASEAPAIVIAVLFVLSGRAAGGMTAMISDKINQWTLLVGMLPLAMSLGAASLVVLPLDARQHEEFFLTAAQSVFGVSLLIRLQFGVVAGFMLASLFSAQVILALLFQHDQIRAITSLTWLGWVYLILAAYIFMTHPRRLAEAIRAAFWDDAHTRVHVARIDSTGATRIGDSNNEL
ncbi:sodium:proton exchanger [Undibacterium sp. Jales W-56]|uniref:sodium/calcium exchanger protein n=1 Tax=Undibacterium sp. Jales W-56 TaxID=2897325 RepID=UPI0021D08350|nr:sodium:proton exchanger [Undibacterium sp. Jales W-56]MCU6435297.1 sodium:proton exchanger [Undibacterium sp. Jales W-56]